MACFHPVSAWRSEAGDVFFGAERKNVRPLTLPCGQCIGCRLERSRQSAVRCMHEASLHDLNSFVTLTYDSNNLSPSLNYRDFQLFMKRLRKSSARDASGTEAGTNPTDARSGAGRIRFFMCGEYGDNFGRPHFHALLFGKGFADRVEWKRLPSGSQLYRSKELERLWPYGFSSVGDVTFESAAYVARYCMKKVTGDAAAEHYQRVDCRTGELVSVVPEFARMSLKPGIGADWIRLYRTDVYRGDGDAYVVVNGMKCKPPRYYDQYMSETLERDVFEFSRHVKALERLDDQTPERLAVRERVTRARLEFKKRSLE